MDISGMSLEAFLNETTFSEVDPQRDAFVADFSEFSEIFRQFVGNVIRHLDSQYALNRLGDEPGDVALTFDGRLVGFYHGNILVIDDAHRGKSLSIPLILEASKSRPDQRPQMLSDAGRASLTRAWRVSHGLEPNPWP